jgi:hypothetical protein
MAHAETGSGRDPMMKQISGKKNDPSKVEFVSELDDMRPAERVENKSISDAKHEKVSLPDLDIREVSVDNKISQTKV